MYVLRLLIDEDIPLNEGVFDARPAGVAGVLAQSAARRGARALRRDGGRERRDVAARGRRGYWRLRLAAASQGHMNNLLFGDAQFGYYETLCGGSGATADEPGADAVHTHMTNTRLTDPEILERRVSGSGCWNFRSAADQADEPSIAAATAWFAVSNFFALWKFRFFRRRRGPYPPYGYGRR